MSESIIPIIRLRMGIGSNLGMELSYSYDYNFSKLNNINAVATNELALNIYFFRSKRSTCPAQGKWGNNRKWGNVRK